MLDQVRFCDIGGINAVLEEIQQVSCNSANMAASVENELTHVRLGL